ncbi:Hypothetical predicted protein [Mytilus galloprovincialis]|uniref:DNA-directed DNA polymerase n=1 Tax=Mytilus galloprovincialis TaxID=29158 RepID=A0A8B6EAC8_MYTGA|nr:Hypothetical predicted protein [Mytilus galloprovincialis]
MEAKKDKILSKRGDSYKLVLTKEYKHKASIYVFNYKISLKDEKQETFTNAFDHMVDYSIKDYPNGRIKIVPIHEIIITKHKSWPIRTYNTVKKLFMDQMERLLNSAEELNLEEVIFEVTIIPNKRGKGKALKILDVINKRSIIKIKNDDTICLSRAIVTSLASNKLLENFTNSQLKHIKEGRPLQKRVAEDLHEQSGVEIKKEEYNIMIQHAKRGGEKKLFINNKCYKVDGYYYDRENKMRNVYEFFGCYWHGCTKCYSPEEICKKDRNKKTMKELYDQTKERLKTIEDYLKPNVKIHTIWECEFDQQKYPEVDPHLKPIDKRDAFYGGRTETIQLYNNLSDLKDEDIVLTEYKNKEEYSKPNPSVNVYIALFTTAHARLKLYELLDILQERVLYMDTDSCIYNDDGSEACKKIESMMGNKLGDLTDEIVSKHNANHIKQFISAGPKDYSMKLDTEKLVSCCKGFRLNAEVEKKITLDKKIKIVTDENEKYETVKYNNIKIGKDHQLKTVKQVKAYDYMFDKRMVYCENENLIRSFPYGY